MEIKEQLDHGVDEVQVLSQEHLTYGLPTKVFGGGLFLTVAFVFVLPWYIGVLFGVVFFVCMYAIHETDVRALLAWGRVLRRHTAYWSAGKTKRLTFIPTDYDRHQRRREVE